MRKLFFVITAAVFLGLTSSCGSGTERNVDTPDVGSAGTAGSEHKNGEVYEREGGEADADTVSGAEGDRAEQEGEEEGDS